MVIGHDPNLFNEQEKQPVAEEFNLGPAARLDRLAASVIDFFIVFSVAKVFASKSLLSLKIAFNFDLNYTVFANLFNIVWLSFSVYLLYTVITYRLIGCTLGQYFFSLRIVHDDPTQLKQVPGQKIKLVRVSHFTLVLRTILSFLSVLLIFPIFGMFLNPRGKSFFDKVCDTLLITTRKNSTREEYRLPFHRLVGSLLVLAFFSGASLTSMYFMKKSFNFEMDFSNNSKVCQEINSYHNDWNKNGFDESRLDVAVALYSAGELSVECLTKEIDFEFSINSNNPTAYFAKGLLSFENEDSVIRYFKQACKIDEASAACSVSAWISVWPNFLEGESLLSAENRSSEIEPTFYKVWLIKRYHQKGMLLKLSKYLEEFKMRRGLEGFYAENLMRVKLFQEQKTDFDTVLKLIANVGSRDRNLTESFCSVLISDSCQRFQSYPECNSLTLNSSSDSHLLNMKNVCYKNDNKIFASDLKHETFYKLAARQEPYLLSDLKTIFMDTKSKFGIRFATLNRFFDSVNNEDYLNSVKEEWEMESSKDFVWRLVGEKLKNKYITMGDTQKSFEVYKTLTSEFDELKLKDLIPNNIETRFPAQISDKKIKLKKGK